MLFAQRAPGLTMEPTLKNLQTQLHDLCALYSPKPFFLRRSLTHDCLWVSDLSRRVDARHLKLLAKALENQGFFIFFTEETQLLGIDLSREGYAALLQNFPILPPLLPANEFLHPAYALCRLLLSHPVPFEQQPLAPLREILKAVSAPEELTLLQRIPSLSQQCAQRLREKNPLPHAAGRVLAEWLITIPSFLPLLER